MTTIQPAQCLDLLLTRTPMRLEDLPTCSGAYGLWDPFGTMRYIGSTQNIRDRIWGRHVAGTEGGSHKLAHELNQHLFYVDQDTLDLYPDRAKMVRGLRQSFIRSHYKATFVAIRAAKRPLEIFEGRVKALALPENRLWNDTTVIQTRLQGPLARLLREFIATEITSERQREVLRGPPDPRTGGRGDLYTASS
jgi:hypothetical protein